MKKERIIDIVLKTIQKILPFVIAYFLVIFLKEFDSHDLQVLSTFSLIYISYKLYK